LNANLLTSRHRHDSAVEQLGVDPADACPDHWRHIHNRLSAGDAPRPYTREQHRAWLLRRRIDL
jgi:hypothetical protein